MPTLALSKVRLKSALGMIANTDQLEFLHQILKRDRWSSALYIAGNPQNSVDPSTRLQNTKIM